MEQTWCGTVSYSHGLVLQEQALNLCSLEQTPTLLGLEHLPVITLGKRLQNTSTQNCADIKFVPPTNVEVCFTDRGGEATLHSPGQLVVYPVWNIRNLGIGIRDYVCLLERALVKTLSHFGIHSFIVDGQPGVYTDAGKIAFLGIRVKQGITQHGLSLNVCNDLTLFNLIRPCGKDVQTLDSMLLHDINATPKDVFVVLSEIIQTEYLRISNGHSLTTSSELKECSPSI